MADFRMIDLTYENRVQMAELKKKQRAFRLASKKIQELAREVQAILHDKHVLPEFDRIDEEIELRLIGAEARLMRVEAIGR